LKLGSLLLGAALGLAAQQPGPAPVPAPAAAPAPAHQDPAQIQRQLAEVKARQVTVDEQLDALKKRRKGVLVELQSLALEADRMRAQADTARLQRDQAQLEVASITARKEEIQHEMASLRLDLRRQVRWMLAKGPMGDLGYLTTLSSFEQYVVQERYQVYLRDQERQRMARILSLQEDLGRREKELQEAMQRLAAEEQASVQAQAGLQLHEARLQQALDSLQQDESQQKEVQSELAEEALQLERMLSQLLGKPRSDAFEATTPFVAMLGSLPQPTPGTLAQSFGEHLHPLFKTRTMQTGLLIAADQGAPVQAVADGKVVFADLYQSFGPMVILDHGAGYYTLYTHLEALTVAKGQVVKQGDPVGSVGTTVDGPRLGFEIRHLTQPQDPNRWLKVHYR
jgi:septal ring factor EnvC (AmiA/AmiB activator)